MADLPPQRLFGQILAVPRRRYCVHIPLLLLLTGLLTWVVPTDFMLAIASFVGGVVGFYMFFEWVFRGPTRFSTTLGIGLLTGYAGGSFNTWATVPRAGFTLGHFLGLDDAVLARGIAGVLISCAILIAWGELFEKPIFGLDFEFRQGSRLNSLIVLGMLAVMAAFKMGALSYMGVSSEGGHLGLGAAAAQWFFPPLVNIAVTNFVLIPGKGMRKWVMGICAFALLLMLAVTGRRTLIYTCAVTLFMIRMAGFRLMGNIRRQVMVLGLSAVFIVTCSLGFMLLRVAGYNNEGRKSVGLQERMTVALALIKNGTALDRAVSSTQENVKTRTFVLGFLAQVLDGSERKTPGLGRDAFTLLQAAVPSAINPYKHEFASIHENDFPSEEFLADSLFGFSYWDEANSILTAGAVDFGLIGMILYPIITAWCLRWVVEFASSFLQQTSALFLVLSCLFEVLSAENTITSFAVTVFHGILFITFLEIFFRLPRFQLRAATPVAGY
ncbi:hypothetical protein [Silvibacterium dinghuense]|uniref:Uncharacterized protein n=1 Tax=Silvibacterium dinghuense TaxID=1560006 RepID=A0A4Q1SD70_9BACT|nr:hypothetical protein [Silvibacterium dinghuense]RXS95005.1 hypothetical protein ESZ00_10265 [Silvibacterium dinghuense]GGH09785.1 hypothetical protein GCM10011586_27870 [Silvibacterium dinghuense]